MKERERKRELSKECRKREGVQEINYKRERARARKVQDGERSN